MALRTHASVREAFVGAGAGPAGEPELWAWVAPGAPPDLLAHLRARLPATLVPARVIACASLPRLPGGKVDRSLLPAPSGEARSSHLAPPRGPIELVIAEAWRRMLKVKEVDRHANFFDLGGNSLLALAVHAEIGKTLSHPLALVDLFRYPTVAELGARLTGETVPALPGVEVAVRAASLGRRRPPSGRGHGDAT